MIAMGCPAEMIDESEGNLMEEMRDYFTKHQGNAPMADSRFSAALDKIKSVQNPTKADFAEVVALMNSALVPSRRSRESPARAWPGWLMRWTSRRKGNWKRTF